MTTPPGPTPTQDLLESGDPADDARAFRRALAQFATGVTIVTTSAGDTLRAMAVNSFSAVSLDPPLVLWSIRKESRSRDAFEQSGHFAISVLADDQIGVSNAFGRPSDNPFEGLDWSASRHGDPLIEGAIAHLECTMHQVLDGGDHLILVGRVDRFAIHIGQPLLFSQGQYGVVGGHPMISGSAATASVPTGPDDEDFLFPTLIKAADRNLSHLFEERRRAIGVTTATGRVLNVLAAAPHRRHELEADAFLGENVTETALEDLLAQGRIAEDVDGRLSLTTSGRELRTALRQGAEQFTADQLRGISVEDLAAAKRVLATLATRNT